MGFFTSKKEIKIEDFLNGYYIPLVDNLINSELDLIQKDIFNNSNVKIEKNVLYFELFVLLTHLSGRGLTKIDGLFKKPSIFTNLLNEVMEKKFTNINLNKKWLSLEKHPLGDMFDYYKNKINAYQKTEIDYHNDEIDKGNLRITVSSIFLSIEKNEINNKLADVIGEIHEGGFVYLFNQINNYSKEYKIS